LRMETLAVSEDVGANAKPLRLVCLTVVVILSIPLTKNLVGAKHSPSNLSILRPSLFGNASPRTFVIHLQIPNRRDSLLVTAKRV